MKTSVSCILFIKIFSINYRVFMCTNLMLFKLLKSYKDKKLVQLTLSIKSKIVRIVIPNQYLLRYDQPLSSKLFNMQLLTICQLKIQNKEKQHDRFTSKSFLFKYFVVLKRKKIKNLENFLFELIYISFGIFSKVNDVIN